MSLLSSPARLYLDAYKQRPVSEVADIETWVGLGGLYVDPVFQHSRRHNVGSIRDLVKAGSVGFVEDAFNPLVSSPSSLKAGAESFMIDARANTRHFF